MIAIVKALVFVGMIALFIPIILAAYWWITLPVYYGVIALEFRCTSGLRARGVACIGLARLIWIQMGLPLLTIALYPIMPGSTATGEPLGLNEKAYLSFTTTLLLMVGCIVTFAVWARQLRRREKTDRDREPHR